MPYFTHTQWSLCVRPDGERSSDRLSVCVQQPATTVDSAVLTVPGQSSPGTKCPSPALNRPSQFPIPRIYHLMRWGCWLLYSMDRLQHSTRKFRPLCYGRSIALRYHSLRIHGCFFEIQAWNTLCGDRWVAADDGGRGRGSRRSPLCFYPPRILSPVALVGTTTMARVKK